MGLDSSYTKVLLHMNGADASITFTDESGKTWTAAGNAQIDTAQSKFGGASGNAISVASNANYISTPDHADLDIAAGNFTIDFWYRGASASLPIFASQRGGAGNQAWTFVMSDADSIRFNYTSDGTTFLGPANWAWTSAQDIWYHIALVRNGANLDFYVDGVKQGTTYNIGTTSIYNSTAPLRIWADELNVTTFSAWMEEFRFSVGVARWTANFTPPTAEYKQIDGELTATLDALTLSSAGEVATLPIDGELTATLEALTSSAAGAVDIVGVLSVTLGALVGYTVSSIYKQDLQGVLQTSVSLDGRIGASS